MLFCEVSILVVALLALAKRVYHALSVLALSGVGAPTKVVVALLAHPFRIVLLFRVRTRRDVLPFYRPRLRLYRLLDSSTKNLLFLRVNDLGTYFMQFFDHFASI